MMLCALRRLFLLILLAACLPAASAFAQTGVSGDTIFIDIELTPEGVVAYDSAGYRWEYDFSDGVFVRGDRVGPREQRGERGRPADVDVEPVFTRCTEQLIVEPFQRSVQVGTDEFVSGDIVAVGRVTVNGWVQGSVQSINEKVLVTETGQVDGDIKAPEIQVKKGGIVLGNQVITNQLDIPFSRLSEEYTPSGIWVVISFVIFLSVCAFVVVSLLPRQHGSISEAIARYPVRSFGIGVVAVALLPLLILLLAITIVGVLLVAFLPLIYLFGMAMGAIAWGGRIGALLLGKFGRTTPGPLAATLLGNLLIMLPWLIVAILMGSTDDVVFGFGVVLLVLTAGLTLIPIFTGLGASVLTRFGARRYLSLHDRMGPSGAPAPTPAPPPIPPVGPTPPPPGPPPPPFRGSEPLPPRPANE